MMLTSRNSMKRFFRFFGLFPLVCVGTALAHSSGESKVAIRLLDSDSLTVTVEARRDEYTYSLQPMASTGARTDTVLPGEAREYQKRISAYLPSHINLYVDGRRLNLEVIRWKPRGQGPKDGFEGDPEAFWGGYFTITLGARLPPQRERLDVSMQLFWELGISPSDIKPVSEVSLYWRDMLLLRKKMTLDDRFGLPISPDSLSAISSRLENGGEKR